MISRPITTPVLHRTRGKRTYTLFVHGAKGYEVWAVGSDGHDFGFVGFVAHVDDLDHAIDTEFDIWGMRAIRRANLGL